MACDRILRDPHSIGGLYSPEFLVERDAHPFNAKKRRLGRSLSGIVGKMYSSLTLLDLIIDDMFLLYSQLGWVSKYVAAERVNIRQISLVGLSEQGAGNSATAGSHDRPPCANCGKRVFESSQEREEICKNCGAVCGRLFVAQHRQKFCAEADDKTQVMDRPHETKSRFEEPSLSCAELRKKQDAAARGNTHISEQARKKYGLGFAQESVNRKAAAAERVRSSMSAKHRTKETHILIACDQLFARLQPIDKKLERHVRVNAYTAWQRSVVHADTCTQNCRFDILLKPAQLIAESAFFFSLQSLIHGETNIDGVPHSEIVKINQRMLSDPKMSVVTAPKRATRQQIANILNHADDEIPKCEIVSSSSCNSSPAGSDVARIAATTATASAAATTTASPLRACNICDATARFDRSNSSGDMHAETGEMISLRDALSSLMKLMPDSRVSTKSCALAALANPEFRNRIFDARGDKGGDSGVNDALVPLRGINIQALAYVLLCAVAEEQADHEGCDYKAKSPTKHLLLSLNIDGMRAKRCTQYVRDHLPVDIFNVSDSDNGLFAS
jgi:hypothetical protein